MKQLHSLKNALDEFIHHAETSKDGTEPEYLDKFLSNLKDLRSLCGSMKEFMANMDDDMTDEQIDKALKPMFDKYLETLK